jgi:hypothetical protein
MLKEVSFSVAIIQYPNVITMSSTILKVRKIHRRGAEIAEKAFFLWRGDTAKEKPVIPE